MGSERLTEFTKPLVVTVLRVNYPIEVAWITPYPDDAPLLIVVNDV